MASGDPRDWAGLIESVGPASLLVVIASRMGESLHRKTTPEDVLQDVLGEAWAARASIEWRGIHAFRSFLLTLIDRRLVDAADYYAALKRGGAGIGASAHDSEHAARSTEPLAAVTTTPSRLAAYHEQAAMMRAALLTVPEDCREVVRLRLFDEQTSGEIATRLGIGESAVRHRFRRGVEVYRRALERLLSSRTRQALQSARAAGTDSAPSDA